MLAATAAAETRSFPATPAAVTEMDNWIDAIGSRWAIEAQTVFRARVCVAELAANVLEHGNVTPATDSIGLELRRIPRGIEIEISDPGAAYDPATAPLRDATPDDVGGRGLRIVRSYASSIAYRHTFGRNVVTLRLIAAA